MEFNKDLLFSKTSTILSEAEKLGATQAHTAINLEKQSLTRLANK